MGWGAGGRALHRRSPAMPDPWETPPPRHRARMPGAACRGMRGGERGGCGEAGGAAGRHSRRAGGERHVPKAVKQGGPVRAGQTESG